MRLHYPPLERHTHRLKRHTPPCWTAPIMTCPIEARHFDSGTRVPEFERIRFTAGLPFPHRPLTLTLTLTLTQPVCFDLTAVFPPGSAFIYWWCLGYLPPPPKAPRPRPCLLSRISGCCGYQMLKRGVFVCVVCNVCVCVCFHPHLFWTPL